MLSERSGMRPPCPMSSEPHQQRKGLFIGSQVRGREDRSQIGFPKVGAWDIYGTKKQVGGIPGSPVMSTPTLSLPTARAWFLVR